MIPLANDFPRFLRCHPLPAVHLPSARNVYRYFKVYKPYGMLSQFTREAGHPSLADLDFRFPKDVYPVGRLDHDTEGLLLLTNDPGINKALLAPDSKKRKTYWVQVEGLPDDTALTALRAGVTINLKGKLHQTLPALVKNMPPPNLPERNPSVNYLKHPVNSWIELSLTEGKNHQVRKMTAKVGHPTLRLIRFAIENVTLEGTQPGEVLEMKQADFQRWLNVR
jgi:23S rRNA pseudouridine2457 synthase